MNSTDVFYGVIGGTLIGLSTVGLMLTLGRIGGISGIIQASMWSNEKSWRIMFLIGLIVATSIHHLLFPDHIQQRQNFPLLILAISGFIVGIGVALGNGCTSGHGICGISRFSKRSIVATVVFFALALISRYLLHNLWELVP